MEIYQSTLPWLLALCIFVLLIRIRIEIIKVENLKKENSSLIKNSEITQASIAQQTHALTLKNDNLLFEKISLEKARDIFSTERTIFEESIKKSLDQIHSLSTATLNNDINKKNCNYQLYPELEIARINFSTSKITNDIVNITESTSYKDFRQRKIKSELKNSGDYNPIIHGYIYAMYNFSLPGVVKIGCSDAPQIRAKELTAGEDFRSNVEYALHKKKFDNYSIGSVSNDDNLLREYVQNLNLKLKTALPSPFIVAFFFESFEAYNDECLLHFALKDFNIYRGAGTEFFALSLHQVYEVFKSIFPNRAYQYPNFTPPK